MAIIAEWGGGGGRGANSDNRTKRSLPLYSCSLGIYEGKEGIIMCICFLSQTDLLILPSVSPLYS
jgi:hypothetical protein